MNKTQTKYLVISALMTTLMCVGSYIKIPFIFVPLTMQFFFVNLSALIQPRKYAVLSVLAYVLLGLIGLPVFSGGGGIGYVLTPTFGYIIGFFLSAVVSGTIKPLIKASFGSRILLGVINIAIIYICGLAYFYLIAYYYLNSEISLAKLWISGCAVFIPSDTASMILSALIAGRIITFIPHAAKSSSKQI